MNIKYSDKLHQYGIHGIPHNIIKSYFANRTQEGKCLNDYLSNSLSVEYGVPQGSILSPQPYVNDFFSKLKMCKTIMCARDTSVINMGINQEEQLTREAHINKNL